MSMLATVPWLEIAGTAALGGLLALALSKKKKGAGEEASKCGVRLLVLNHKVSNDDDNDVSAMIRMGASTMTASCRCSGSSSGMKGA
jgi:hypothetical protein